MKQKNQTQPKVMAISSSMIVDHLDSIIVHLAKTIAIEQQCPNEHAVQKARQILINKASELRTNQTAIPKIISVFKKKLENNTATTLEKVMYKELLALGAIDELE